jgi:lincosamide nucleotidyltransferase A/C/D/E
MSSAQAAAGATDARANMGGGRPLAYRLLRAAFRVLTRTRAGRSLLDPLHRTVGARIAQPRMSAAEVLAVLDGLEAAGVPAWLAGGWGVDALAGHERRPHEDADVVIPADREDSATAALQRLGFRLLGWGPALGSWSGRQATMVDDGGRLVDLHAVDLPDGWTSGIGTVAGRNVPCLSCASQLELRLGHPHRSFDLADIELLSALRSRELSP